MIIQRASTSFPASTPQWKYDVFLSFRGEDTRRGFTDILYNELEHEGIITFRDEPQLQKGETIAQALFAAIEESRFSVIVLSQNYASSTWCLNELVKILECMNERGRVLPIFYDVDPSDVRKQTGSFGEAFADHEERFADDKEIMQKWRSALTEVASFSGWNSKDWSYERELIRAIVKDVLKKMQPASFSFAKNLVGMDSILPPVFLHLGVGVDDVRFIGIWGMGGIGKTTVVRAVNEMISGQFEFSFLLTNIRETVAKGGLLNLQKQLLSGMMRKEKVDKISDILEGATAIERQLRWKKVLVILDDVNHSDQLEYLAGNPSWFGSGSRVLITTRNEHLLIRHKVERRLKVGELSHVDSLKLFSKKAFKKDYPEEDFLCLSESVTNYAKGLPLALEVLGSFLYGRDLSEWISALSQLGKVCHSDIFDVLKISYNDLDPNAKKIFLDIACFFNGEDKDRVTELLTNCDIATINGIEVLMERSILTRSYGRLQMHDLLQEMGRQIVHLESPNELGRRSRLWLFEDVKHVLTHNTGTEAMEGIFVDSTESEMEVNVTPKSFSMMRKLRYLKIKNGNLPKGLEYLPDDLRILDWTRYPLKSLPADFNPRKLFELTLCHSCLRHVQIGTEPLRKLNSINLSHSLNLVKTPNFKDMPYLEILCLEGCISLNELDPGIELLKRLSLLNLKDCKNLVHFAGSVRGLKSLKVLNLSSCSKVKKLPNDMGDLESLEELYLNGTSIKEVPMSTGRLERLIVLNLKDCKNLACLPSNIGGLKSLKDLNLSGCSKLEKLTDELGHVACLENLDLSGSGMREVPSFIGLLKNLKELYMAGLKAQSRTSWNMMLNPFQLLQKRSHIPVGLSLPFLSGLRSLTHLDVGVDDNTANEEVCMQLIRAENLTKKGNWETYRPKQRTDQCKQLCTDGMLIELLPTYSEVKSLNVKMLFKNLVSISFESCGFIKIIPDISGLPNLKSLNLDDCTSLVGLDDSVGELDNLVDLSLSGCHNLITFPRRIHLKSAKRINFKGCRMLENLPKIMHEMECLTLLDLSSTAIKELPSWISYLRSLEELVLKECEHLTNIPRNIYELQHLWRLDLQNCSKLVEFPDWSSESLQIESKTSHNLWHLNLCGCKMLEEIPELPPTVEWINVADCLKLKRFAKLSNILVDEEPEMIKCITMFNCQRLCSSLALEIAEKGNLFRNDGSLCSFFLSCKQSEFNIVLPGSEVPQWFSGRKDLMELSGEFETSFKVPSNVNLVNKGFAICAAAATVENFKPEGAEIMQQSYFTATIGINANKIVTRSFYFKAIDIDSAHMWLCYVPFVKFVSYHVPEFTCKISLKHSSQGSMRIKSFGCHLVFPQDEDEDGDGEVDEDQDEDEDEDEDSGCKN